ncbi:hypothetical protein MDAP_001410 [Mitosporidium daphniae]|uniref:tRNA-uridine aminocarboxypropyltransferase 1 n=1 Tax=Mitosporidium daphniae TaxID=1485682 RepID=A0A098VWA8_9MICR|nr:uncharacterized protein DI09_102p60 [Mitosporidium daphniae]KGG53222.1 hypothetical protein DI09_102p60 [Mitosporidium daphniae]|eukprot:XP_013239658.1 uncharacterized protein DI09_102p60 [Mitosporidium daphniae]
MGSPTESANSPFAGLSISSHDVLRGAVRERCPKCLTYSKYYCYTCFSLMPSIPCDRIPKVSASKEILVWKHPNENIAKCTSVHALLLFQSSVRMFQHHPTFHDAAQLREHVPNPNETIILYPSKEAPFIGDIDTNSYKCVVFLESSWAQSTTMFNAITSACPGIRTAQLDLTNTFLKRGTLFWRYQNRGEFCLSTIEAIYLFCTQIDVLSNCDNALYFFSFFYHLIQEHYGKLGRGFSGKHRLGNSYIQFKES